MRRVLLSVGIAAALTSAGCGKDTASTDTADTATQRETTQQETTSRCDRAARTVDEYDITQPGASREDYLRLLHQLQSTCPKQADDLGLTGEGLKRCKRPDQESCTMYRK